MVIVRLLLQGSRVRTSDIAARPHGRSVFQLLVSRQVFVLSGLNVHRTTSLYLEFLYEIKSLIFKTVACDLVV